MQKLPKVYLFLLSLICLLSLSDVTAAKFYKWIDADGNINYSDKEPLGVESAETISISAPKTSETVNTIPAYKSDSNDAPNPEEQKQNDEENAKLKEYCDSLTANIKTLEMGGRVKTVDAEGNQKFLSDEEQQAKAKRYQGQYDEKCASKY
jgi:hypothetical protein